MADDYARAVEERDRLRARLAELEARIALPTTSGPSRGADGSGHGGQGTGRPAPGRGRQPDIHPIHATKEAPPMTEIRARLDSLTGGPAPAIEATHDGWVGIDEVMRARQRAARHLRAQLAQVRAHTEWTNEFREAAASALAQDLAATEAIARHHFQALAATTAGPLRTRVAEGVRLAGDEVAEAQLMATQYRDRPKHIMGVMTAALAAGATRRARVAYAAGLALDLPELRATVAGPSRHAAAIESTDEGLTAARHGLELLRDMGTILEADIAADRAAVLPPGPAQASASIAAKHRRARLGFEPQDQRPALSLLDRA